MTSPQLSAADLNKLASCAQRRIYSAGEYLLHRSEVTNSIFYIQRGTVAVLQKNKDPLASDIVINSGEFLGEISFLLDKPRTATVVAREETECLVFDPTVLRTFLFQSDNDALGRSFYQSLAWIAANRLVSSSRPSQVNINAHHDPLRQHIERRIYAKLVGLIESTQRARKKMIGIMRRAYQIHYDESVHTDGVYADFSEAQLEAALQETHDHLDGLFKLSVDAVNQILTETHSTFRRNVCGDYAQRLCMPVLQDTPFFMALSAGGFSETLSLLTQVYQAHHRPTLDPLLGDGNISLMMNYWLLQLPTFQAMRSSFVTLRSQVSHYLSSLKRSETSLKVTLINDISGGTLAGIFVPLAKRGEDVECIIDTRDGIDSVLPWNGYSQSVLLQQRKMDFSCPRTLFREAPDLIIIPTLLDYLPDTIAESFLSQVCDTLRPGGRIYLSCLSNTTDQPFVTSVLGWSTIRRSRAQLQHLLQASGLEGNIISDEKSESMVVYGVQKN